MAKSPINIVCATDDKYAPYCGVMLTSVFLNNQDKEVHVYVLVDKPLSADNQNKFAHLVRQHNHSIAYCNVDNSIFQKYPLRGYGAQRGQWSIVTYYRLLAEEILPSSVETALYLDCDVVVTGSLGVLFDMDWTDVAVGVVPDMSYNQKEFYQRLQYDESEGYFNAGMVFINFEYWRQHSVGKQCMEYLQNHYDRIWNNDQDVLNAVLCKHKRMLPVTYNFQIQFLMPSFYDSYSFQMQEDIRKTPHPLIIHYASELKPWMAYYYFQPYYDTWQKYKKLSPWRFMRDQLPQTRKWRAFINRFILWPLGIKIKVSQLTSSVCLRPIKVFVFHQVSDVFDETIMWECDWNNCDAFKCMIKEMQGKYQFISLKEAYEHISSDVIRRKKYAVLTADDGYASLRNILPWLAENNIYVTLFLNPAYLVGAEMPEKGEESLLSKYELEALIRQCHPYVSIASHGWTHSFCTSLSDEEFVEGVNKSVAFLEQYAEYVPFYAYPCGKHTDYHDAYLLSRNIVPVYCDGIAENRKKRIVHRQCIDNGYEEN